MIGKIYVNLKNVNMLLIKKFGKMTFFFRNSKLMEMWRENKHGDPHFFFYFMIDNDNMDNFREFNCCKIIFTIPD